MTLSQCQPAEQWAPDGLPDGVPDELVVTPATPAIGGGSPARPPGSQAPALLRAVRVRQWPKNVLVFAAPVASGAILQGATAWRTLVTFWVFVAASAATYLVNDVVDRKADRHHPVKRHRPVASGRLSPETALASASLLALVAVAVAFVLALSLGAIVGIYLLVSMAYSCSLKRVPVVELACVGSGFTLRAMAGGAAAHVFISPWFLVMVSFGALLVVAGKRSAEAMTLGDGKIRHRRSLSAYPVDFLRTVRTLAISVTVTTYCLWAFQRAAGLRPGERSEDLIWFELSVVPFLLAVLMLELALQKGRGGEPEELALSQRGLQCCGLAWVAMLLLGIYS